MTEKLDVLDWLIDILKETVEELDSQRQELERVTREVKQTSEWLDRILGKALLEKQEKDKKRETAEERCKRITERAMR